MLAVTANKLKKNDVFTPNNGETWFTALTLAQTHLSGGSLVILMDTAEGLKLWFWPTDEVIVRL